MVQRPLFCENTINLCYGNVFAIKVPTQHHQKLRSMKPCTTPDSFCKLEPCLSKEFVANLMKPITHLNHRKIPLFTNGIQLYLRKRLLGQLRTIRSQDNPLLKKLPGGSDEDFSRFDLIVNLGIVVVS